jgi:hypothetical protein
VPTCIRRYSHFIWWFGLQLYKAALGNCFEIDDWGPIEFSIMAKHFDRQGKPPYAYHAVRTCTLAYIPFTDSSRTPCLLPINSDFVRRKHPTSYVCFGYVLTAQPIYKFDVYFLCVFQQYLAHLLSHGQLDGSG